jgi:adenine-specific DNA-methyltransferase
MKGLNTMKTNFKTKLYDLLKKDFRLWDEEKKELNETLLKYLIDKLDKKLIELLLNDKETNKKFFVKVKDVYVLKQNELKFFIDENKLDNSYTQYQNKIGLKVGNKLLSERDEVVLDWPFKDCVLEGGMTKEDQKRNEIFFNEILAKDEIDRLFDEKALVNWKKYTKNGEQEVKEIKRDRDGTIQENLIIKGNNLLALHSLKKQFTGKVKLIYIDPPYNTGNDGFKYNDNFNHSAWLTFMKNRLEVARELLRDNGVIFVQCDDNEQAYLKVLMDNVFGRENFINVVSARMKNIAGASGGGEDKRLKKNIEFINESPLKTPSSKLPTFYFKIG